MHDLVHEVLAELRHAEMVAAASKPGSPEYHEAMCAVDRLHAVYQELLWSGVSEKTERMALDALAEIRLPAGHSWVEVGPGAFNRTAMG